MTGEDLVYKLLNKLNLGILHRVRLLIKIKKKKGYKKEKSIKAKNVHLKYDQNHNFLKFKDISEFKGLPHDSEFKMIMSLRKVQS